MRGVLLARGLLERGLLERCLLARVEMGEESVEALDGDHSTGFGDGSVGIGIHHVDVASGGRGRDVVVDHRSRLRDLHVVGIVSVAGLRAGEGVDLRLLQRDPDVRILRQELDHRDVLEPSATEQLADPLDEVEDRVEGHVDADPLVLDEAQCPHRGAEATSTMVGDVLDGQVDTAGHPVVQSLGLLVLEADGIEHLVIFVDAHGLLSDQLPGAGTSAVPRTGRRWSGSASGTTGSCA